MIDLIKSEGFWACLGAIIGGLIGGAVSLVVAIKANKIEIRKQKAIFLQQKIKAIESVLGKIDLLKGWKEFSKEDLLNSEDILISNAHYFDSSYDHLILDFNKIIGYMNDESEDIYTENSVETSRIIAVFVSDVKNYMLKELKDTVHNLTTSFK